MSRKALIGLGALVLVVALGYYGLQSFRGYEEFRPDRTAANDLIRRGWIPDCISDRATEIHVKYFVDTNEVWGRFAFEGTPFGCPLEAAKAPRLPKRPGVSWWTVGVGEGRTVFTPAGDGRRVFAVVDSSSKTAFFWRPES